MINQLYIIEKLFKNQTSLYFKIIFRSYSFILYLTTKITILKSMFLKNRQGLNIYLLYIIHKNYSKL